MMDFKVSFFQEQSLSSKALKFLSWDDSAEGLDKPGFDEWAGAEPELCILPDWTPGRIWHYLAGVGWWEVLMARNSIVEGAPAVPGVCCQMENTNRAQGSVWEGTAWSSTGGRGLSAACTQFWKCRDCGDRGFSEPSFLSELWSSVFPTFQNSWHKIFQKCLT